MGKMTPKDHPAPKHFNKCGSNFLGVLFKQLLDIHAVDLQTVYLAIVYLNVCKVTVNEL